MDFCILQERQSGEDFDATAWATEEEAKKEARNFLANFVPFDMQNASLEEMEDYCFANDLAYIQISFHRLELSA